MLKHYAVIGKRPQGKPFRGVVATDGASHIVLYGPSPLAHKPWNKRPLTLAELRRFAKVRPCPRPRLTATIKEHLEHKFTWSMSPYEVVNRGRFLSFIQALEFKLQDIKSG